MADDVLNAEEVESLRRALAPPPDGLGDESDPFGESSAAVLPFVRPEPRRVSEALMRSIAMMHERMSREFAADLSSVARRPARVRMMPLCQASYREFSSRLANPTCLNVVAAAPTPAPWVLEITPGVLFPAIDLMLGGAGRSAKIASRPLTDIEMRLAARITALFLARLRAAWQETLPVELAVERVACSPQAQIALHQRDAVVWTRFEVEIVGNRGLINLAIPVESLVLVKEPATNASEPALSAAAETAPPAPLPPTVELVACLAKSTIPSHDALNLDVGDLITTEQPTSAPIDVEQDGVVRFRARPGALDAQKAVEITAVVKSDDARPTA